MKLGEQSAAKRVFEKLAWLLEHTPESLGALQGQIRGNLEQFRKANHEAVKKIYDFFIVSCLVIGQNGLL